MNRPRLRATRLQVASARGRRGRRGRAGAPGSGALVLARGLPARLPAGDAGRPSGPAMGRPEPPSQRQAHDGTWAGEGPFARAFPQSVTLCRCGGGSAHCHSVRLASPHRLRGDAPGPRRAGPRPTASHDASGALHWPGQPTEAACAHACSTQTALGPGPRPGLAAPGAAPAARRAGGRPTGVPGRGDFSALLVAGFSGASAHLRPPSTLHALAVSSMTLMLLVGSLCAGSRVLRCYVANTRIKASSAEVTAHSNERSMIATLRQNSVCPLRERLLRQQLNVK